jgi:hypothetical protein
MATETMVMGPDLACYQGDQITDPANRDISEKGRAPFRIVLDLRHSRFP